MITLGQVKCDNNKPMITINEETYRTIDGNTAKQYFEN